MKTLLKLMSYIFIVVGMISCKKELIPSNVPPVANAGPDKTIIFPKDSVILDGTGSYDEDGVIATYLWTKISGPSSYLIVNTSAYITIARSLEQGIYQFELKVSDDMGAIAKDTVQITVKTENGSNQPPVANAGVDQTIKLPINFCTLNGNSSYDPDGQIDAYLWTVIEGPVSCSIQNRSVAQTTAEDLTVGIYQFELIVIDNEGLHANDTVQVTVTGEECNVSSRQRINATLTQIGTLSEARAPYVAAAGSKIVFAGGIFYSGNWYGVSSAVDIYDINTHTWSTAKLSEAREGMAAVSCGDKIFFAGGGFFDFPSDIIDIYDVSTNIWTIAHLSEPKLYVAAASVGTKVLFAGGYTGEGFSKKVDIYDILTNTWSTASLSDAKSNLAAVTFGNKVIFAGGFADPSNEPKTIDIYDLTTNSLSTSSLNEISGLVSGVAAGENIYWGGISQQQNLGKAEIWNTKNNTFTVNCLSYARTLPTAVVKNNDIVFFTSGFSNTYEPLSNEFDIYNLETSNWSIGVLENKIRGAGIISFNNIIYVGGGELGFTSCTNKVYTLSW